MHKTNTSSRQLVIATHIFDFSVSSDNSIARTKRSQQDTTDLHVHKVGTQDTSSSMHAQDMHKTNTLSRQLVIAMHKLQEDINHMSIVYSTDVAQS